MYKMTKYAVLGYNTINIGDDIQSFVTSTLLNISYIIMQPLSSIGKKYREL